jgi:hypothetical protein
MTASLSGPYALVGETQPSQPAHHKGLPAPAEVQAPVAVAVGPVKPVEEARPVVPVEPKAAPKPAPRPVLAVPSAPKAQ